MTFATGQSTSNSLVVRPGDDGKADLYNGSVKPINLVVDVTGYYRVGFIDQPGGFAPVPPLRLLDTRHGIGATKAMVPAGASVTVSINDVAVQDPDRDPVAVTVTVAAPGSPGYVTVFGHNRPRPGTSSVTFATGQSTSNSLVVAPGDDAKLDIYNGSTKPIDLTMDITGYYRTGAVDQPGGYTSLAPVRVLDTRQGLGAARATVPANASLAVTVVGAGVPDSGVAALAATVTVASPSGPGFVTAIGHDQPRPATSSLTFATGKSTSNSVIVVPGRDGKADFYNGSNKPISLILDVTGYFLLGDDYASSVGGSGRTLYNSAETTLTPTAAPNLAPAWKHAGALNALAAPAIVDGVAYIPSRNPGARYPQLDAVDVVTGETLWSVPLPHCDAPDQGIAIAGNTAFIPCQLSQTLVAVRVDAPTFAWWHANVGVEDAEGVIATDGMVFAFTESGTIAALNAVDGTQRFEVPTESPAIFSARDGRLFVSADTLHVYDDHTGVLLWSGEAGYGFITVDAGHVIVSGESIARFPEAGCGKSSCQPTWNRRVRTGTESSSDDCSAKPGAADGHTIAVTINNCGQERVEIIDEGTGAQVQTILPPGTMTVETVPVRFGRLLWVGLAFSTNANGFYAYDTTCTRDCTPVAKILEPDIGDFPGPTIAAAHGTLLVQHWINDQYLETFRVEPSERR